MTRLTKQLGKRATQGKSLSDNKSSISVAVAAAFSIPYFIVWILLASPFSAFPGDDVYALGIISDLDSALNNGAPVYFLLGHFALELCRYLSYGAHACDPGTVIMYLAVASNAIIVMFTGLVVFAVTRSLASQISAHVMYAMSAWPVTYHFMVSYTATTAALIGMALYLVLAPNRRSVARFGGAGVLAGLALWSSSAGPLTAGLLTISVVFLLWKGESPREVFVSSKYDKRHLIAFLSGFVLCVALFAYFGLQPLVAHLVHNIHTEHYTDAYQTFGFIPQPPFFTYLHVLRVYGFAQALIISLGFIATILFLINRAMVNRPESRIHRTLFVFCLFVLLHAMAVDALPFTKLGRVHFVVYPISLIMVSIAGYLLFRRFADSIRSKVMLSVFLLVTVSAVAYDGIRISSETYRVRTTAGQLVDDIRGTRDLFVLHEDPHGGNMWITLNWSFIEVERPNVSTDGRRGMQGRFKSDTLTGLVNMTSVEELSALLARPDRKPIGLLVGPHGKGSGLSLAGHAVLNDFDPKKLLDSASLTGRIREIKIYPYYMHYPPFLLEEEICQALFFAGKIPDYRSPNMGVSLLKF